MKKEILPTSHKAIWSLGGIGDQIVINGINQLAFPVYNLTLGVSTNLIGLALAIPRVLDAFFDILFGNYSDKFQSKFGRRKPFILIGSLLSAFIFTILWCPPKGASSSFYFGYLLFFSILYFLSYSLFAIPRCALGFELCEDHHDRSSLYGWNIGFALLAGILLPWLYSASLKIQSFSGSSDPFYGIQAISYISAALILLTLIPSVIFLRERKGVTAHLPVSLMESFKLTFQNKVFLSLSIVVGFVLMAQSVFNTLSLYLNIELVCGGSKEMGAKFYGIMGSIQAVMGIFAAPIIVYVSKKIGKKSTLLWGLVLSALGMLVSYYSFQKDSPYTQLYYLVLFQPGMCCVWLLNGSMIADICEENTLQTGHRREGMFGAVFSLVTKISASFGNLLSGLLISICGYQAGMSSTQEVVSKLHLMTALIPLLLIIVCIPIVRRCIKDYSA